MRVLLDTQVLVMASLGEALPKRVQALWVDPETDRLLSAVSITEIAIKAGTGALPITKEDVNKVILDLQLTVIPFAAAHALRLFTLPNHHRDPFDRMLIATALAEDISVVTGDRRFKEYRGVRVIW
jgi:PIN domain nuclease of toxin-antitoxin system